MKKQAKKVDPNRYLKERAGGNYHYVRRVPAYARSYYDRGLIQVSLKTSDIGIARIRRDSLMQADSILWSSLASGEDFDIAMAQYKAAQIRARALGFVYRSASDLAASAPTSEVLGRLFAADKANAQDTDALLGGAKEPEITITNARKIYFDQIAVTDLIDYSDEQIHNWKNGKTRAIDYFVQVNGNIAIQQLTREHGQRFQEFWNDKIRDESLDPDTARRSLGDVRKFLDEIIRWSGITLDNPLDGLTFKKSRARREPKPPFSVNWIRNRLMLPESLDGLNRDARLIFLALIETGCRPSEIANLTPEAICLSGKVPFLQIRHRQGRVLKSDSSARDVPLTGISLAAIQQSPDGFERYRNKGNTLSAVLNKHLDQRNLKETPKHTAYSLRHSYEDRMIEGGLDYGLRCKILGHSNSRPEYGDGGSIAWRHEQLSKIVLPYDPRLVG